MTPNELAHKIADLALDKKAYNVKLLDLRELSAVCDYFVICTVDADVQGRAVADHIIDELRDAGIKVWHREGYASMRWVLLDYVDVVVHIFMRDVRDFYGLEELWGDAPSEEIAA